MTVAFVRLYGRAAGAILMLSSIPAHAKPEPSTSPCKSEICSFELPEDARLLNEAFWSDATTDAQRAKMNAIIAEHSVGVVTDWAAAAKEYREWRATTLGYAPPAPGRQGSPEELQAEQERGRLAELEEQRAFRNAGEAAVRAKLIDPNSAQFEWPYKFVMGYWKPFLAKRVEGYVTCGFVNARNRMGGYAGRTAFALVVSAQKLPLLVDMDSATDKYGLVDAQCAKAASSFLPSAPPEELTTTTGSSGSVADELEKLAIFVIGASLLKQNLRHKRPSFFVNISDSRPQAAKR